MICEFTIALPYNRPPRPDQHRDPGRPPQTDIVCGVSIGRAQPWVQPADLLAGAGMLVFHSKCACVCASSRALSLALARADPVSQSHRLGPPLPPICSSCSSSLLPAAGAISPEFHLRVYGRTGDRTGQEAILHLGLGFWGLEGTGVIVCGD